MTKKKSTIKKRVVKKSSKLMTPMSKEIISKSKPMTPRSKPIAPKIQKKIIHRPKITQTSSEVKVERILVENFVSLQKVMTNLSINFDNLTNKISKLLELFEISAKALAKKEFDLEKVNKDDKKVIEKIDNLLNQNKTIARGMTLMHEKISRQDSYPTPQKPPQYMQKPPQSIQPPMQKPQTIPEQKISAEGYQKSIPLETSESQLTSPSEPIKKFKPLPKKQNAPI